jgi:hypothetical protein
VRTDKKSSQKADKKAHSRVHNRGVVGYSKKSALLEEAITHMNTGKYGRSSAALKELLTLDPHNTEARRLFATLHLRLGSLVTARQAFESLANEAIGRQDFWLAESLLREYLAAGPRCVPFLELLAHVHEEKGDAMAAVAELGKAIEILIESPDSEDPKKPSQLYAKVRELAPASPAAFQFSSLFDIQTGELLAPSPPAPAAETSLQVEPSQPQGEISTTTEEARASDVMPWEQFEGTSPIQETPPPTSSNPVIESLDVPGIVIEPAPLGLAPEALEIAPSESTRPIQGAKNFDKEILPSILAEPPPPSRGQHDDVGEPIVNHSPVAEERVTPSSFEERTADGERDIASSAGSPGLSSPMPWEQIENSTVKIEEAVSSTAPLAQSDGTPLLGDSVLAPSATPQSEVVSGQLSSSAPVPDLTEPRESIFTAEPSTIPSVLPEPEAPTPSAADSSSTVPFSWNTVFDGAWKFASGTLSSSSPAAPSKPDADSSLAGKDLDSLQPESVPDPALFSPSSTSAAEMPVSFSDPEPLPSADPSILSETSGSTVESDAIRASDLPQPMPVRLSEAPSQPEESSPFSSDAPSAFKVDLPVPPLPEQAELARESEPVSSPSYKTPESVTLFQKASPPEPSRSELIPEAPSAPEPASTEYRDKPFTLVKAASAPPLSVAPSDAQSPSAASMDTSMDTLSRWNTGEVEVHSHRPSEKKRNWDKDKGEAPVASPVPLPLVEESPEAVVELSRSGGWEPVPSEAAPVVEAVAPILEEVVPQEDTRPEWVRASESITFVNTPPPSSATWQDSDVEPTHSTPEPTLSVAASAVDVLFDSTGEKTQVVTRDRLKSPRPRPRLATRVARVRIGISSFIGSCFSTTRSIVLLCVGLALACVALVAVGIGAVGLAWMVMEAPPSSVYHNLTANPPLALTDSRKNGYFMLLGFEASGEQDPLQVGYERKAEASDLQAASVCMLGDEGKGATTGASANGVRGVFTSADPVAQLKPQAAAVRSWVAQESLALKRYQQWLGMPFEDVGYGQILSPNCAHILLAHRLYLAEGFAQDLNTGLGRLETDMGSWRAVIGQSKTLMVKMLAATAIQDDAAIASGLLTRPDLDGAITGRLGKVVRPFDQVELSIRWPMQSHLAWATKAVSTGLKNDKANERPLYVAVAAAMPLPVQRRSNAYADYYEAASKAMAEGRYTNLPKPSSFIRTPAVSVVDYVANPIEHIIGIEPLPSWDPYVGRTVETDARLRLASLQFWIRQGAQDGNVVTRLAKAGQAHYDPFTGLPMLVNQQKGLIYSVGRDGKDQEGDPLHDVVAAIPKTQSGVVESSRSLPPSRSK